jgi:hypothetical protein
MFFTNKLWWRTEEHLQLGNVFDLMSTNDSVFYLYHLLCSGALLAFTLLLNARWFATQWKNFQPPSDNMPPPLAQ